MIRHDPRGVPVLLPGGSPGRDSPRRRGCRPLAGSGPLACGLVAGTIADALLGDQRRGHPVALFGRAAQLIEDRAYASSRARGTALASGALALAIGPALAAGRYSRDRPAARLSLTAACAWTVIGARSLAAEAERVRLALTSGDIRRAIRLSRAVTAAAAGIAAILALVPA